MNDLDTLFGPDGFLADAHDNYEHRPRQIDMAQAVERAIDKRHPAVIEAATGTGKTLAYLIPALRSDRRVVISTGTKALQAQLFRKDIPFLEEHWPEPFEAHLLKGRTNYLCKLRYKELKQGGGALKLDDDTDTLQRLMDWAEQTETGDRAELEGLPDNSTLWDEVSVGAENCLHTDCEFYDECFVTQNRQNAEDADLLVVNHHLFFADLSLRDEGITEILPPYDAVIFDEAHHLRDVATSFFGIHTSNYRQTDLLGDLRRLIEREGLDAPELEDAMRELSSNNDEFFRVVDRDLPDGRHDSRDLLAPEPDDTLDDDAERPGEPIRDDIHQARVDLQQSLRELAHTIQRHGDDLGEQSERLRERCRELEEALVLVTDRDDERFAYYTEFRGPGTFLHAAPIELHDIFREKLLDTHDTLVFTSATLATGGNLEFFERQLGLTRNPEDPSDFEPYDFEGLILPPVFDYENQAALYVPQKMPPPSDDDFCDNVATVVEYLLDVTDGRAFILFTSYSNLNAVYDKLRDELDYRTLRQGDLPKRELLEAFRQDTNSVLFATRSFWEGVDVEGDALSMVVIDKLPFANPSDPLTRARLDHLESRGGNAFRDLSLPSAALALKQGFGRLIRSRSDRGIVAILDSRMANRSYGHYFLDSLPDLPVRWNAPAVKGWWHDTQSSCENEDE
jgi:ATP-dependent DNA helicase DinG